MQAQVRDMADNSWRPPKSPVALFKRQTRKEKFGIVNATGYAAT